MKLKTPQVAEKLGITDRQVRRLIKNNLLPAQKDGKDYVVSEEAIALYQKGHTKRLKESLDELTQYADVTVASPETIDYLKNRKLGIKSKLITYDEYLDDLFEKKKNEARKKVEILPKFDESIADAIAEALYNEFRDCFVLGVNGAAITLAILLLEYSMKKRIHLELVQSNKGSSWSKIERLRFIKSVEKLVSLGVLTEDQDQELSDFNSEVRNTYIHYKIKKLVSQVFLKELPALNVHTGEITIHKNVDVKTKPELWFSAKQKIDKDTVVGISKFCLKWSNFFLNH